MVNIDGDLQFDPKDIPMAAAVTEEKVVYLLDPIGASRRSATSNSSCFQAAFRDLTVIAPSRSLRKSAE